MKFKTKTGSWYELDVENRKVRRLTGVTEPTPRQGPDGEWKQLTVDVVPKIGSSVLFVWGTTDEGIVQTTFTSLVVEITDDGSSSQN